jgi:hypothetical protein
MHGLYTELFRYVMYESIYVFIYLFGSHFNLVLGFHFFCLILADV